MSQKDVGAGGIHPLAGATESMLAAREVGPPFSVGIRAKGECIPGFCCKMAVGSVQLSPEELLGGPGRV